mmetsp:Transcript_71943/g.233864  ORF Transcript_71943/g.233864 Transcript_71943/m.233864 type:complete len:252 (-) Transcript_71943:906-1661(-)
MRRPNSRGNFKPLFPATCAMSNTMSWICASSTDDDAPEAVAEPAATGPVARPRRLSNFSMSAAKLSSSTLPTVAPIEIKARAMPFASPTANATLSISTPAETFGGSRPTMPKSKNPTRPSSKTRRLPACKSAWKKSHLWTESDQTFSAATRVASGSAAYLRMPSKSTIATPRRRSMVKTFFDENSLYGFGATATESKPLSTRKARKTSRLSSSAVKSNSPSIEIRRSDTMSDNEPRVFKSGFTKPKMRAAM